MRWMALLLLLAPAGRAGVDGVVFNQTTGKPQPGAAVTLYQASASGMNPLETVNSDARGAFAIEAAPTGPRVLQAVHDGVVYNQMLQPGAPATGLRLVVYDATSKAAGTEVTQHMILLEPISGILHVSESIIFRNSENLTYNDPAKGALRVYLPPEMEGKPRVMATAPQGVPLARPAVETGEKDVYKIDFPIKPGETRFDLTYVLPKPESGIFTGKIPHGASPVRLVVPQGVTLQGDRITEIAREPNTQAIVYDVQGTEYAVKIEGTGALRQPESTGEGGGGAGIQQIPARIYDRAGVIVGLSLALLALGFLMMYRRGSAAGVAPKGKRR